jgi:Trypsin
MTALSFSIFSTIYRHLDFGKLKLKAGSIDLAKASQFNVTKVEVHPDYTLLKGKVPLNDLAALKVAPEFDFADGKLKAAVLPTQGQKTVPGETVTVAGWGAAKVLAIII